MHTGEGTLVAPSQPAGALLARLQTRGVYGLSPLPAPVAFQPAAPVGPAFLAPRGNMYIHKLLTLVAKESTSVLPNTCYTLVRNPVARARRGPHSSSDAAEHRARWEGNSMEEATSRAQAREIRTNEPRTTETQETYSYVTQLNPADGLR